MEQCLWNSAGNSGTVKVEQCGGTMEQCWWNSGTVMVEQRNSVGGTMEQCWWNSESGTVEQCWWNTVVKQWNSVCGTVLENSGTVKVEQ